MPRPTPAVVAVGLLLAFPAFAADSSADSPSASAGTCTAWSTAGQLQESPDVPAPESSGVAASTLEPGLYYTHNDAGNAAELYLFDEDGTYRYTQVITNATNTDWEDIAAAPCPDALGGITNPCIYIGDIGDNLSNRAGITLWVVPESTDMLADAVACPLVFEDGARDAESLLVSADGTVRVVSKEGDGQAKIYKVDALSCGSAPDTLKREAQVQLDGPATGGFMSDDPAHNVAIIRTHTSAFVWEDCAPVGASTWLSTPAKYDLGNDPKGEGVTLTPAGDMLTTSEGTAVDRQGLLFRLTSCSAHGTPKCAGCGCESVPEAGGAGLAVVVGGLVFARRRRDSSRPPRGI